jgi:hypothetical protein
VTQLGQSCPALATPVTDAKSLTPQVVCFECDETHSQRGSRGFESPLVHQISYIIFGNPVLLVLPANERDAKSEWLQQRT